jgi:hypothetical protein
MNSKLLKSSLLKATHLPSPLTANSYKPMPTGRQVKGSSGFASLPVVLLLGGLIIEASIAGAFILYYVNSGVYATKLANQASLVARSGIEDAIFRTLMNPECGGTAVSSCAGTGSEYTFTLNGSTARVTIVKDTPTVGQTTITSIGQAQKKQHRISSIITTSSTAPLTTILNITDEVEP